MLAPLFVACVNVGLLILAQTSTRASEFAVRTALGASRGRILTQVFVEFMVLAVMAAGAGLLIWKILHERVRYEERGPAVSAEAKKVRARKMIRELRSLGYRIELLPARSSNPS